jgi:hypothetical protein
MEAVKKMVKTQDATSENLQRTMSDCKKFKNIVIAEKVKKALPTLLKIS